MKNFRNNKHLTSIVTMAVKIATAIVIVLAGFETTVLETKAADFEKSETCVEIQDESSPKAGTISYTFTDMEETTMYAKSAVNVRSLPSTKGTRLGSLAKNQAVIVTGKCNETGWYRVKYNGVESYVSNKYLIEADDNSASASTGTVNPNQTGIVDPNDPSTWAPPHAGMVYVCEAGRWMEPEEAEAYNKKEDGFDRAIAEQIWEYMNAERVEAGLDSLPWNEEVYSFACRRAQEIVTDFSHNGNDSNYAENILGPSPSSDAYVMHMAWHNSPGHYSNYMSPNHTGGACAVYLHDGLYYAVENFTLADGYYMANTTKREFNGQTLDITVVAAEAFDKGSYWVASNGVVVFIYDDGDISAGDGFHSLEELQAACEEYFETH